MFDALVHNLIHIGRLGTRFNPHLEDLSKIVISSMEISGVLISNVDVHRVSWPL